MLVTGESSRAVKGFLRCCLLLNPSLGVDLCLSMLRLLLVSRLRCAAACFPHSATHAPPPSEGATGKAIARYATNEVSRACTVR